MEVTTPGKERLSRDDSELGVRSERALVPLNKNPVASAGNTPIEIGAIRELPLRLFLERANGNSPLRYLQSSSLPQRLGLIRPLPAPLA